MTSISAQWPKTPDQPLRIYRTTPPAVTEWSTGDLAAQLGLRAGRHGTTRTTADKVTIADGHSEVTVYRDSGALRYRNRTRWQLDHGGNLDLGDDDAAGIARAFVERYDLAPLAECRLAKVTRLRVGLADREGTTAEERVIDVGVIFRRAIDGLATDGPGGNVMVYIGADGEPTGVDRIWRGIADVAGNGAGVVAQPVEWVDAGNAHEPARREHANHGTRGSGHANGIGRVGARAKHAEIRRDGRNSSA